MIQVGQNYKVLATEHTNRMAEVLGYNPSLYSAKVIDDNGNGTYVVRQNLFGRQYAPPIILFETDLEA